MAKMTRDEAIKNVTAYVYMEYENMPEDVIRALDVLKDSAKAWDKVKEELDAVCTSWNEDWDNGFNSAVEIINKHLCELQQEE